MKYNPFNKLLSGLELKDWIWYNTQNNTKYSELAKTVPNAFNLDSDKFYIMKKCNKSIQIIEASEKGKKYGVPCDD